MITMAGYLPSPLMTRSSRFQSAVTALPHERRECSTGRVDTILSRLVHRVVLFRSRGRTDRWPAHTRNASQARSGGHGKIAEQGVRIDMLGVMQTWD
jgi:hypothetical protein